MIKIISDSSALFSVEEGKKNNVDIAPLVVTINGASYKEYEEINTEEFINIINEGYMPISSQPSIGEVVELYEKNKDCEIINISMADGLSGTYNSACMAKNMVDNSENIEVINSKSLCGPQKYLVKLASELVKEGKGKNEIVDILNKTIDTSKSFLIPMDYDYLVRGGRLSSVAGKIGSIVKLIPVLILSEDGKSLANFTIKRTFKKAIDKISEELISKGIDKNYKIYISHSCAIDLANTAKDVIMKNIEDADIEINILGPAFTTQGGPGCVAIQVIKKYSV